MPITNKKDWETYVKKNKDEYGKCCVDIARKAMEILDEGYEIKYPNELITKAEKEVGEEGITGFMAGAISYMITRCHSRGEEWKKAWNKSYGDEGREGVINPALVTVTPKGEQ